MDYFVQFIILLKDSSSAQFVPRFKLKTELPNFNFQHFSLREYKLETGIR